MDNGSFRRRSHRESNGFHSGYVPVDEEYLQHSGIRGKRSWCLCTLLVFLLLIAVVNALVGQLITKPCPSVQYTEIFSAVKIENFNGKISIFSIFLLKTLIVGTC